MYIQIISLGAGLVHLKVAQEILISSFEVSVAILLAFQMMVIATQQQNNP